jgi:putative FmdB family regulatory protein
MPVYEYQCTQCGEITEAWQKFSDLPLSTCCQCQSPLKKLISPSSFHLKGSGWYVTDYKGSPSNGSSPQKEATAEKKEASAEKNTGDTAPKKEGASETKG